MGRGGGQVNNTQLTTPQFGGYSCSRFKTVRMAELDPNFFGGQENISDNDWETAIVQNLDKAVRDRLKEKGWVETETCCSIGLTLGADNQAVEHSQFMVSGPVETKTLVMDGQKLWPEADAKIQLAITLKKGELFRFSAGGLSSDIIGQEEVEHGIFAMEEGKQPAPIMPADYEDWGVGHFSIRMLCVLSKNSGTRNGIIVKYTVIIFPEGRDELLGRYEAAQSPAWPGFRLAEGYMPLLPRATTAWKCPVIPFVVTDARAEETGSRPASAELRRAVAATMGAAVKAATARTAASLATKWTRLLTNPGELVEAPGDLRWPPAQIPPQDEGNVK